MEKNIPLHSPIQFIKFEAVNPMISKCSVKIMYTGKNRNYSYISKDVAEKMVKSLPNTPIVGEYNSSKGDFLGHADYIEDDNGEVRAGKRTIPIGVVPSDTKIWWELSTDEDGSTRDYLCCEAYIWTGRYPEAKRIIEKGNNQSMELDPASVQGEWAKLDKGGPEYFVIKEAYFSALCVLGEDVEPCFEGAQFNPILYSLLKNEEEKLKFNLQMEELMSELKFALTDYKKEKITNFPNNGDDKEISLRNSQWELFDPAFAANLKENHPDIWRLGGNIRGNSQYRKLTSALGKSADQLNGTQRNAIELREAWVARHHKDFRIAGVIAQVKWLAVGSRGEKYMKNLIKEEIKKRAERKKSKHSLEYSLADKMQEALMKLDAIANRFESKEDLEAADALDLIISDLDKILSSLDEGVPIQSDPNDQSLPIYEHKKEDDSLTEDLKEFEKAPSDDTGEDSKEQYADSEVKEEELKKETQDSYAEEEENYAAAEEEKETLEEEEKEGGEEPKTFESEVKDTIKAIEAMLDKVKNAMAKPEEKEEEKEVVAEEIVQDELEQYKKENEDMKMELAALRAFKEAIQIKEKEAMMEKFSMLRQDFLAKLRSKLNIYSLEQLEAELSIEAVRSGAFFEKQAPTISYSLESQNQDPIPAWIAALENLKK